MNVSTVKSMEKIRRETFGKAYTAEELARYNAAGCLYHMILSAEQVIDEIAKETKPKKDYSDLLKVFVNRISTVIEATDRAKKNPGKKTVNK